MIVKRTPRVGDMVFYPQKNSRGVIVKREGHVNGIREEERDAAGKVVKPRRILLKFEAGHWSGTEPTIEIDHDDEKMTFKYPERKP